MSGMTLGWMIIATLPDGQTKAMPSSPEALDLLPNYLHDTLPTLGGVWNKEGEALIAWGKLPLDIQKDFQVVPVTVTILKRDL